MGGPHPNLVARLARGALREDLGPGDLTGAALIAPGARARGLITAGARLVAAGLEPAIQTFLALDPEAVFERAAAPGAVVDAEGVLLEVEANAGAILSAERTALNFLGRLSGIATLTRRCVDAVQGTGASAYDTRKTAPGLRQVEQDAVTLAGGMNPRCGLFDAVLIK